ncbi:hypothetical protein [Pandoraea communis]|uniref:hypothetical protein n=1 Tax=Pandoraea communis TaxID=2508297 RepID=UPI0025A6136F|nr:hypothetical protein [Pandoraea communis]MDM8356184.1 hypothetical protein [Pandoraea communis]
MDNEVSKEEHEARLDRMFGPKSGLNSAEKSGIPVMGKEVLKNYIHEKQQENKPQVTAFAAIGFASMATALGIGITTGNAIVTGVAAAGLVAYELKKAVSYLANVSTNIQNKKILRLIDNESEGTENYTKLSQAASVLNSKLHSPAEIRSSIKNIRAVSKEQDERLTATPLRGLKI